MLKYLSTFRTDLLFSIAGFCILVIGFLQPSGLVTLLFNDHYVSFNNRHIILLAAIIFFAFALVYFLFLNAEKKLNQTMGIIHLLMTFLSLLLFYLIVHQVNGKENTITNLLDNTNNSGKIILFSMIVFFSGKVIFLFNIYSSLKKYAGNS